MNTWIPLGLAFGSEFPSVVGAVIGSSFTALNAGMAIWIFLRAWQSTNLVLAAVVDCLVWMQFMFLLWILSFALL